jgi:hypothetical protein
MLAVLACAAPVRIAPGSRALVLAPVDSLRPAVPAAGICVDGEYLVLLEQSGTRLLRFGPDLVPFDTVPLSERLAAPEGVAADRFYYYVYDGKALYRIAKDKLVLQSWLGNVRVAGLAGYSAGEMLVSDADRGVVWYKTLFGDSRTFLDRSTIKEPGNLVALPDGEFCVLSAGQELVWFNRAGIVTRRQRLAQRYGCMTAGGAGRLVLGVKDQAGALVVDGTSQTTYEFGRCFGIASLAVLQDRVFVLDRAGMVEAYRMP